MFFFVFKQKTAYEMRISDWSSDVCSSDLVPTVDDAEPDQTDAEPGSEWVRGFPQRLLDTLKQINPTKLRPRAVVYVHLHQAALDTGTDRKSTRLNSSH